MININKKEINLEQNSQAIKFEYTKYSRFSIFDSNNNNFDIQELELNISGKDYNRIKSNPIKSNNIYDNNIISHKLINSYDIQNTTIKDVFVAINYGNLFKIPAISILEAQQIKREISIISLTKLAANNNTYDQCNYNINSAEASLTKPLLCDVSIKENDLDNLTVYIIPELNIMFSYNKENLEAALASQAISAKYRSVGNNDNIIIEKDEDFDTKTTYDQLLKNFSMNYNIIINDPNNYLRRYYYYTYINNQVIKIWVEKNNLLKPGVYFISFNKDDNICINEVTLKYFKNKIIYEENSININDIKYFISESKIRIQQYFDNYQDISNEEEIYLKKLNELENQNNKLLEEIKEYKKIINQKDDEIAILNNRINLENRKNISENTVKRAEQLLEKEQLAYEKVRHTYEADIKAMNLKSYIGMGISICGLLAAIITLIKKSK